MTGGISICVPLSMRCGATFLRVCFRFIGSKYQGDNQPDVIIDYRLFPNDGYQPTYRDRRYVLDGYAVCEDFYSPDYSQKPLPDTKDYRRTLYWMPNVKFDSEGKATVNLYNNSKPTVLSIQAEGITTTGTPIVWNSKN